jgi:isopropylmalate/homocitrate/citramalate synthase
MKIELTADQITKIIESHQSTLLKNPATYSIIGASRVLGISESSMHRRIKEGFIQTIIIGKSPRVSQEEIDRLL